MSRLRTAVFINAHSRRARHLADRVARDFSRDLPGFDVVDIIVVKQLEQFGQHLQALAAISDLECVIIGSGDGTIVSVLQALKGRDIVYGFLPLGTSNVFMRSLDLPLTYPLAKRVVLKGQTRRASIGAVNGMVFANNAGIGLPAAVSETLTNQMKRRWGPLAYVVKGFMSLRGHQAFYCHVINDEVNESFYTHYLMFANGKYHGNLSLGKEISAYDDKLVLFAVGVSPNRRHFVTAAFSFLLRRQRRDPQVKRIVFERLFVTTQPSRKVEADGEVISQTPATVEILKDAITVLAKPPRAIRPAIRMKQ